MKKNNKLSIIIFLFLVFAIIYPICMMLIRVSWDDFLPLIRSSSFKEALSNSLVVTSISTVISILLSYILSYTLNRTNIKHRAIKKILITLPMLIPSISHGLGLINLFGSNGIISSKLGFDVVGATGIIIGSVMYSFPVAFLIIDDGYNYIDNNMYDVSKTLGLNKWQTFKRVTLCYLFKPILSATFAVFTLVFTDYGVPLAIGGKYLTLPVFLYKEVIGLLDFSKGTIIGLFLLIPAVISFLFDTFSLDYTTSNYSYEYKNDDNKRVSNVCKIFLYFVIIFVIILIFSFVYYAFVDNVTINNVISMKHIKYIFENDIFKYIFNSLIISLLVAIFGTVIAYFSAYITSRTNVRYRRIIHFLIISSLAIPGIVLGLSYTISFNNSFIYNTYIILIVVNIIHFIASPYLLAYNALQKVDSNYEIVAKTCNISVFRILFAVIIPITKKTIREMFAYFFVNSMITISAIAFLFNTNTMPLSLLINNYEGNMMLGEAAIISLIILFFNLFVKGIIYLINRYEHIKGV